MTSVGRSSASHGTATRGHPATAGGGAVPHDHGRARTPNDDEPVIARTSRWAGYAGLALALALALGWALWPTLTVALVHGRGTEDGLPVRAPGRRPRFTGRS